MLAFINLFYQICFKNECVKYISKSFLDTVEVLMFLKTHTLGGITKLFRLGFQNLSLSINLGFKNIDLG